MPKNKQKQMKKSQKKQSTAQKGSTGIVSQLVKSALPMLMKAALTAASGIPFPTSGARAIASPSPQSVTQLSAPSANGALVTTSKARISNSRGGITVTHREYITDVIHTQPDEFELLEFQNVNPGNSILFPWLSSIAQRYETYRFDSLKFIYEPQTATTSLGTVMMAVDYDASDTAPSDKTQMMSYKGAVRSPAWFAAVNTSDKADLQKQKNYYVSALDSSNDDEDTRLTNVGKFILAMQSESAAYTAGELYVEYIIRLETPQLQGSNVASQSFTFNSKTVVASTTSFTVNTKRGTLGVDFVNDAGISYLTFQKPGLYFVEAYLLASATIPVGSSVDNMTFEFDIPSGSDVVLSTTTYRSRLFKLTDSTIAAADGVVMTSILCRVPNPDESIVFNLNVAGTWNTAFVLTINVTQIEDIYPTRLPAPVSMVASSRALRLLGKRRKDRLNQLVYAPSTPVVPARTPSYISLEK